jgi:pyrroline-5-carboxylate reductase
MRAMILGGIQIGFDAETASKIVFQIVKGGTIVGLNEMEHQGFCSAMVKGVIASYQKNKKTNEN